LPSPKPSPKQKAELALEQFIPYRLSLASNAVSQVIASTYEEEYGLKTQEWRLVAVLAEGGELTQQELVRRTKMDKVTISRAAQVLEAKGILTRVPNADDARSLRLSLTADGRRIYRRVVPFALDLEREVLSGLTAREIADLRTLLRRVESAADRLLAARRP